MHADSTESRHLILDHGQHAIQSNESLNYTYIAGKVIDFLKGFIYRYLQHARSENVNL